MSGLRRDPEGLVYGITATSIDRWHRYSKRRRLCKPECIFCAYIERRASMKDVAEHLSSGFTIARIGERFLEIRAYGERTVLPWGGSSIEAADDLYAVIAGKQSGARLAVRC